MNNLATITAFLATLGLFGCGEHLHSLIQPESDRDLTVGWFKHEGPNPPSMMLEFRGQRFEGHGFAIDRTENLDQLRRLYGSGRHYDRIVSGLDTDHYVYSAHPQLRSTNGIAMQCSIAWRDRVAPAGSCVTSDGEHISFRFE